MARPSDDILARRPRPPAATVPAVHGLEVEHLGSGFVGVVEDVDRRWVRLRDDSGLLREFGLDQRGFRLVETSATVTLTAPAARSVAQPDFTASGAVASGGRPARVARANRLLVEGVHDAELIEKVWGDELRDVGLVVEPIGGVDNLVDEVRARRPGPDHRLGVLLDHFVPGSKESRVAATVASPFVLVDGHAFVDVWQAVRPSVVGLVAWPVIPRGQDWKTGICTHLGEPDPRLLWRRMLGKVSSYVDVEPSMVGAVERLLDFLLPPEELGA